MKAKILTTIFLAIGMVVPGQSLPDTVYFSRLYYTCKVWGFVKYFHPAVADRSVDFDAVLLNALPKMREVQSSEGFNQSLAGGNRIAGNHTLMADLGGLPSGLYFVRLLTDNTFLTSQLIKN